MHIFRLLLVLLLSTTAQVIIAADFIKGFEAIQKSDFVTALAEFYPLAQEGDSDAQFYIGTMHQYGQGVPQDHKTATGWLLKSALQGNHLAELSLGIMYEKEDELGGGTQQDYKEAVKWYSLAAESGILEAQMSLGQIYSTVLVDDKKAVKWFSIAAKQGNAKAQFYLGLRYFKGAGVLSDFTRSYMWFNLSGYNGASSASKAKEIVMLDMTTTQIAKAQEMSNRCLNSNYDDC